MKTWNYLAGTGMLLLLCLSCSTDPMTDWGGMPDNGFGGNYTAGTQAYTFTTSAMVTTVGSASGGAGGGMGGGMGRP